MHQDFLELLLAFERHKVRYVVIGGYAVGIHAEPRYTKDLDILMEPSLTNAKRMLKALSEFGAPVENLSVKELATPGLLYIFGVNPLRVDILNNIKKADIGGIMKRGKKVTVGNTSLRVVSLDDLITLKRLAGRPQDKADIAKLFECNPRYKARNPSAKRRSRT